MIGVLGGMGPAATADFFRRLIAATPARRDQDHLHIIIDNDPSVPDRTQALLNGGPDPSPTLIAMGRRLEAAGANILVAPCNTAAAFTDAVAEAVEIALLKWDDAVVDRLRELRPYSRRIGVLATTGTIRTGIYRSQLERTGLHCLEPINRVQDQVGALIVARKSGVPAADLMPALASCVLHLRDQGAQEVLLACTELSEIASIPNDLGCIDAMDLVISQLLRIVERWNDWPPETVSSAAPTR